MNYKEVVAYLFKQLPMYQREGKSALKKDLTNITDFCNLLGNPERQIKCIHIAGTNGKGSTAHMLASVFQQAGYKTGLYTSPHLKDFRERVKINGGMISEQEVIDFYLENKARVATICPSFFEWTVALAFQYFAKEKVDIAIIETGLGGRLDSTNIIIPEISVITNIGLDHKEMLGDSKEQIAREKAGIIKENRSVVIGENSEVKEVFVVHALEKKASIFFADELKLNFDLTTDLAGEYQKENCRTTYAAWLQLRKLGWLISFSQFTEGLKSVVPSTSLLGRWQIINSAPKVVLDTAHNEEGLLKTIAQAMAEKGEGRLHFVLGFVKEKEIKKLLCLFPKFATFYFCSPNVPRGMQLKELKNAAMEMGYNGTFFKSVLEAKNAAINDAQENDLVYIGGSTFVVAEAL